MNWVDPWIIHNGIEESNDQLHRLTERVTELESELDGIILQMVITFG